MKTILATIFLAMLTATATAGGLRGGDGAAFAGPDSGNGPNRSAIAKGGAIAVTRASCTQIKAGKACKKRKDCRWSKPDRACAPKKTKPGMKPETKPVGGKPCHDHTQPLPGGKAPFAWKTRTTADGATTRNSFNTFKSRIAESCCAVPATEATTLSWPAFMATQAQDTAAGCAITIPCGTKVLVDGRDLGGQPIVLAGGLYVEGELEFADAPGGAGAPIELRSPFVFNCGVLRAGSPDRRFASSTLDIVLTGETELFWRGSSFGKTGFVTHGGETYLRSASCDRTTWTRLAATANAGATEIRVQIDSSLSSETAWRVGDELLVTTTGYQVSKAKDVRSEVVKIAGFKADGRTVVLAAPGLKHKHVGCEEGDEDLGEEGCVIAAEVAPLTRNIRVRGEASCAQTKRCGHTMFSHTNHGTVCGVEFFNLGQRVVKGKYPLHFHAGWDAPELVVRSNAVHASFNRGMVIHAMRNMEVKDNTVYNTLGHNFLLEDGVEENIKLIHNLGVLPKAVSWRSSKGCCMHAAADTDGDQDGPEDDDEEGDENEGAAGGLRRRLKSFQTRAKEDAKRCPGVTKDTCGNRSDGVPNAFWIPNPKNALIDNTGVAELGKAFRIETRGVIGDTVLWFAPEARKIGRKGKIKNVVPMGFSKDGEFFGYSGNTAHSSSIGFLNYPMLRPPRGAEYSGYVAWRNHMGISVRNSGRPLKVTGATLVENSYGVLAHIFKSRVTVTNSRIVARPGRKTLPFKMKKSKRLEKTLVSIKSDDATKRWARCHGEFFSTLKHKLELLKAAKALLGGKTCELVPNVM